MTEPLFANLQKRLSRKLKYTARFYPVDLHCHTPLSLCFGRKDGESQDDIKATPMDVAVAACQSSLFILAVTDHQRSENAQNVAAAAQEIKSSGQNLYRNNNLVVLPGMEIAVEENTRTVHVLAVFAEDTSVSQIERVLDDTGVEPHPEHRTVLSKVTTKRLVEIAQRIRDRDGLVLLAHINSNNGYRMEMKEIDWLDNQIIQAIQDLHVDAIEISKPDDLPHFISEGRQLPCIIGSDAHYLKDIGGKDYITRVKMTDPSFSDLKRALQDPETRICFQEPSARGTRTILGISLDGGFLDGQTIAFTTNLNCLIGGRGTGKSSLIEAIRYLFEHSIPVDRHSEVHSLRDEVLTGCTATLVFQDQYGEAYVLQRTYGDPHTKVMTLDGIERSDIDLAMSQNLLINIYGWSEIEGVAKDSAQQLDLIDSFIQEIPDLKKTEEATLGELEANAREIHTTLDTINRESTRVGNLTELLQELKNLGEEETEIEKEKAKVDNELELLEKIKTSLEDLRIQIENIDVTSELETIQAAIQTALTEERLLDIDVFEAVLTYIRQAKANKSPLLVAKAEFLNRLQKLQQKIKNKTDELEPRHQEINNAFAKLLEKLDQPEAKQIARRREQLRQEIRRRQQAQTRKAQAETTLGGLRDHRQDILSELKDVRKMLYEARLAHIAEIEAQLPKGKANVDIALEVVEQGNRESFIKLLTEKLVNLPRHWRERDYPSRIADEFTPIEFAEVLNAQNSEALEKAEFNPEEASDILRHFQNKYTDIMEFEACPCTDRVRILFDVEGQKKSVEHLSPGQRCTALLPIILVETDTPLIIDQPEDNLDNQFIFDLVVDTMRKLKERRQIIVATHNPNIPVSGDAENILVFTSEGNKGKVVRNGSIDYPPVIDAVKTIMEGGEVAFVVRMKKYGLPVL